MNRDRLILSGIIIIVLIIVVLVAVFTGNNTFNTGSVYFEYPRSWSQNHVVGNFNNSSLYSEVTLGKYS